MLQKASSDLFIFVYPRSFVPKEIRDKYYNYLNRLPNPIEDIGDFLSHTVQSIEFPSVSQDPKIQNQRGIDTSFRDTTPYQQQVERNFTITMQNVDGYLNYWIMMDLFYHYYDFQNSQRFINPFDIYLMDSDGNVVARVTMKQILFTSLSTLELSYANNVADFKTFDCQFVCNQIDLTLAYD